MVALSALLWAMFDQARADDAVESERAADVTRESIELRLRGNHDFLIMLAGMRSRGELDLERFANIGTRYVTAHPAHQLHVGRRRPRHPQRDAAGREPADVGLPIDLPEPARAVEVARTTRQAVYTKPFEAIQGNSSFELWIPVFRNDAFLGMFAAVYSAQQLLEFVTPPDVSTEHQVQLRDEHDSVLAALNPPGTGAIDRRVEQRLESPGNGTSLQLGSVGGNFWNPGVLTAAVVAAGLALGMLVSMTSLRREVVQRKRAQVRLHAMNEDLEAVVAERTAQLAQRNAELETARRDLEAIAYIDVLTGLANRRMLTHELQQRLSGDGPFTILLLDLDRFKDVNDTYGHDAGDALLLTAADRLRATVGDGDFLARMGGDEFAILLDTPHERARVDRVCAAIVARFAEPVSFDGCSIGTTPSIGAAQFPDDGTDQERLLKSADIALYAAKQSGRNTWSWFVAPR